MQAGIRISASLSLTKRSSTKGASRCALIRDVRAMMVPVFSPHAHRTLSAPLLGLILGHAGFDERCRKGTAKATSITAKCRYIVQAPMRRVYVV